MWTIILVVALFFSVLELIFIKLQQKDERELHEAIVALSNFQLGISKNTHPLWISVRDRLPEDEYIVLLATCKFGDIERFSKYHIGYYCPFDEKPHWELDDAPIGSDFEDNPDYVQVTHWALLPPKPTKNSRSISVDA